MDGVVRRIIFDKGFGFIEGDNGQQYFFHRTSVKNDDFNQMQDGTRVTFDDHTGSKGPRAENVLVK